MEKKGRIKVIVPFHNPGDFFDLCINSILTQDFEGFDILFIDDASTDGSYDKIPACTYKVDENGQTIKDEENRLIIDERHPLLENTKCDVINAWRASERMTALPNIHNGIVNFCESPEDIIFILYGDDWLPGKKTLQRVWEEYQNGDCLMTYGSAKLSDGKRSYSSSYSEKEFRHLRLVTPKFSWPLTFKKKLYDELLKKDKKYENFIDSRGEWFTCCSNYALAYPLMELAGHSHVKHISEIIYIYNTDNPLNSERVNPDLYYEVLDNIQGKKSMAENINLQDESTNHKQ